MSDATGPEILHLSLPVRDLEEAKRFYAEALGCDLGRVEDTWFDAFFFGCQLTLHERPDEVRPAREQGVRHFGVTVSYGRWQELVARLQAEGVPFLRQPSADYVGTPREQHKAMVCDPSGNAIEVKSYADPQAAWSAGRE